MFKHVFADRKPRLHCKTQILRKFPKTRNILCASKQMHYVLYDNITNAILRHLRSINYQHSSHNFNNWPVLVI
jgi:hypothetical protein